VPRRRVVELLNSGELPNASRLARKAIAFEDALELVRRRVADRECSPLAEPLLEALRSDRLRISRAEAPTLALVAALERVATPRRAPIPLHEDT
jgi:hypothetical protein